MPTAPGKGKIPIGEAMEKDPIHTSPPGMPRIKMQKPGGTSASMVGKKQPHRLS
jgi:hypothetical protein